MERKGFPRFLVMRGGALGDFIVTLPVLSALRERWPGSHIELVGYPRFAQLALESRIVDKVTSLDKAEIARLFSLKPQVTEQQAEYYRSFHLAISFLFDPAGTVKENLLRLGMKQVLQIDPRPDSLHASDHLFKILEPLAIYPEKKPIPDLSKLASTATNQKPSENLLAVHPGSGSPKKNWPIRNFIETARLANTQLGLKPVFLFGEADEECKNEYMIAGQKWEMIEGLGIVEVARRIANCRAYIGNDSGISHLAASLGTPSVVIFGPSNPNLWAPRGPFVKIIAANPPTAEGLLSIKPKSALEELRDLLNVAQ